MPRIVDHDERRDAIAEAACKAIAKEGIDAVTLTQIGEAANCTTGAITHYFADKDAVMQAALECATQRMNTRMAEAVERDPTDLRGFLASTLPIQKESREGTKVWYSFWTRTFSSTALSRRQRTMHVRWYNKIVERLEAVRDSGLLKEDIDIPFEAETLAALINGIGLRSVLDARQWPADRQLAHLDSYLEKILVESGGH
jgi:AcrR family transcriptional regulator